MRNADSIKCVNGKEINHKDRWGSSNERLAKKGCTLIELMIAMVIVGVLATIALPMYQNYMEKVHFSEAVSKLGSMRSAMVTYLQTHP